MQGTFSDLKTAVRIFVALSILTGLAYPFLITEVARYQVPEKAEGSLVIVDGKVAGSVLIGQEFSTPGYFHGRPSAVSYAADGSGASNLGPTSARLMEQVSQRIERVREETGLSNDSTLPPDLVLASGSGLDPHISPEGALIQVQRVAESRGLPESDVKALVERHIEPPQMGILGQERINVLELNLALGEISRERVSRKSE